MAWHKMKQKNTIVLVTLVALLVFQTGCVYPGYTGDNTTNGNNTNNGNNTTSNFPDNGDFIVAYAPTNSSYYQEWEAYFKQSQLFEDTAAGFNDALALPYDVGIVFGECGQVNAFYSPDDKQIILCYELIESLANSYVDLYEKNATQYENAVIYTTFFIFYHELGHAVIDIYDIPISGKEEDVADQFSTWILVEADAADAAITGADWFYSQGAQYRNIEDLAFWDVHSLDLQRYQNILCWVYGYDQQEYNWLVYDGYLHADRAAYCPHEYDQLSRFWRESKLRDWIKA